MTSSKCNIPAKVCWIGQSGLELQPPLTSNIYDIQQSSFYFFFISCLLLSSCPDRLAMIWRWTIGTTEDNWRNVRLDRKPSRHRTWQWRKKDKNDVKRGDVRISPPHRLPPTAPRLPAARDTPVVYTILLSSQVCWPVRWVTSPSPDLYLSLELLWPRTGLTDRYQDVLNYRPVSRCLLESNQHPPAPTRSSVTRGELITRSGDFSFPRLHVGGGPCTPGVTPLNPPFVLCGNFLLTFL